MALSLVFPDSTYSSSNKPSVVTLQGDLSAVETAVNANETDIATNTAGVATNVSDIATASSDLTTHEADTSTHGVATIAGLVEVQTLTNKTLTAPEINGAVTGDSIATGATITTGTANDDIVTSKALADADVNTRLSNKLIQISRDLTVASGDVAYTGFGFTPTSLIINYNIASNSHGGNGFVDSSKSGKCMFTEDGTTRLSQAHLIFIPSASGQYQMADVKSYDADGFTLTWAKTASPTGTVLIDVLAVR